MIFSKTKYISATVAAFPGRFTHAVSSYITYSGECSEAAGSFPVLINFFLLIRVMFETVSDLEEKQIGIPLLTLYFSKDNVF